MTTTTTNDPLPQGTGELEHRAWWCLTGADRPLTPPELAELAGLTRGGALQFLTGWVAAGLARRTAPDGGRYAPYAALFDAAGQEPVQPPAARRWRR